MLGCHELIVEEVAFKLKFLVEQLQLDERPSAYLEGGWGGPPPIEEIFAPFKYSLSSFLTNHVHNLCRKA